MRDRQANVVFSCSVEKSLGAGCSGWGGCGKAIEKRSSLAGQEIDGWDPNQQVESSEQTDAVRPRWWWWGGGCRTSTERFEVLTCTVPVTVPASVPVDVPGQEKRQRTRRCEDRRCEHQREGGWWCERWDAGQVLRRRGEERAGRGLGTWEPRPEVPPTHEIAQWAQQPHALSRWCATQAHSAQGLSRL